MSISKSDPEFRMMYPSSLFRKILFVAVIPVKTGIQNLPGMHRQPWIPASALYTMRRRASAGMTNP
jgi:hypothetical protein